MAEENNLPDWLRQLRDQQIGPAEAQPAQPAEPAQPAGRGEESALEAAPEAAPASGADDLGALREIASVELPVEEPRRVSIPIVSPILNQLTPFQRFVLALMLFLNVSVLGCLFLMVMQKISFVR
jgi:hypothetical protein